MRKFKSVYEYAKQLARAIDRAVEEHGAPNTFSFGELHAYNGGPSPLLAGRALKDVILCELVAGPYRVTRTSNGRVCVDPIVRVICHRCERTWSGPAEGAS